MGSDPVATVVQTFKDFLSEARVVLRHPWTFPERLGLTADNLFSKGTGFVALASAVVYLLCIPVFIRHDMAVSKGVLVLIHIAALYVFGAVLHLMLKLMGSRGVKLKETMGLYGYQLGIQAVGMTLVMYPSFLAYRVVAEVGLGGVPANEMNVVSLGLVINWLAFMIIGFGWLFIGMVPLYVRYHHWSRWGKTRVSGAFVLAAIITWPFVSRVIPWLYKVGKFL
jgi:hypothetical protein